MSYAEVAASGPQQTAEEVRRAPPLPEVVNTTDTETSSLVDVDTPHVASVDSSFTSQRVQTNTQAERIEREFKEATNKAKAKSKSAADKVQRNADNPVLVGNTVVMAILGIAIGTAAYKRWQQGPWSWQVWGGWTAGVAAIAVGDYLTTKALFKKYPPKE